MSGRDNRPRMSWSMNTVASLRNSPRAISNEDLVDVLTFFPVIFAELTRLKLNLRAEFATTSSRLCVEFGSKLGRSVDPKSSR